MKATDQAVLRHDDTTILLHWVTAILIVLMWTVGQIIDWFPRGTPRISARSTHILLGVILLCVLLVRIAWRVRSGSRLPSAEPAWMGRLGKVTHYALYLILATTLLLGVLNVFGRGDKFFALFAFPRIATGNDGFKSTVEDLHALSANVLVSLAALHALAALAHHFVRRDGVLRRMLR
jgi:cytochrome b561